MADDGSHGEEWLAFSSSCFENQTEFFEPTNTEQQTESPEEDIKHDTYNFSELENVRELFKQSLSDYAHVCQKLTFCENKPSASTINESCKHWIWVKLVSNLNAVRQPKWPGSSLEECYHQSLKISKNLDEAEPSEVVLDNSYKDFFNFHGVLSTKPELNEANKLGKTDLENELVNKTETKHGDTIKSLDLTDSVKDGLTGSLDDNFEDLGAELEWSENDVKDDTSLSNASLSSSGINESEATAELARLPFAEILRLRDELKAYTKQYSDVLVVELENRDAYIREKELKNEFISSLLSMQEKLRETNATTNKQKFSLLSNTPPSSQSLTIIPYEMKNGGPSIEIMEKLIEIMDAMKTNSAAVPTLLTNYILKVLCK